jgi:hypothetical protein
MAYSKAKATGPADPQILVLIDGVIDDRVIVATTLVRFEEALAKSDMLGDDYYSAEAKKIIFRKYINTKNYVKLRLFDDAPSNLQAFLSLKKEYPNIKFEAYFVNPDGSIKTVR